MPLGLCTSRRKNISLPSSFSLVYCDGMNTTDLMRDSFYAPILFQIERRILDAHRNSKSHGIELTDSQVRSILHKVRKSSTGATPQMATTSPRERILADLYEELIHVKSCIAVASGEGPPEEVPTEDWMLSLRTVEDSIRLRSTGPGSRAYLNSLEGFLPESTL
jgi:hypothetical protein